MPFLLGRNRAFSALGFCLFLVLAFYFSSVPAGDAVAEPTLALEKTSERALGSSFTSRSRIPVQLVSHHEGDDEHEDHEHHDEEWDDEDDWDEEDQEFELRQLEIERAALETFFGSLELVEKIGAIAADDDGIAVLAAVTIADELETGQKLSLLKSIAEESASKAARRVAMLKLAEAYREQDELEAAAALMQKLALGSK